MISKANIIIAYLINKYPTLDKIYYFDELIIELINDNRNYGLVLFNDGSIFIKSRFATNELILEQFNPNDVIRKYTIENILT